MTSGPDRYLPTTPGIQLSLSVQLRSGPRARLAHLWHRRHRFGCSYCQGPLLAYIGPSVEIPGAVIWPPRGEG